MIDGEISNRYVSLCLYLDISLTLFKCDIYERKGIYYAYTLVGFQNLELLAD